jgi:hypothetical protein
VVPRLVTSTSALARIEAAAQVLRSRLPSSNALIVAASRGAADDLARLVARRAGATFGLLRFGFTELAARAAASLPSRGGGDAVAPAPSTAIGDEAVATRAVFDVVAAGGLQYFSPVAGFPGFPKALARTLFELRVAGASADRLKAEGPAIGDVGRLLEQVERHLDRSGVVDRAALFGFASRACLTGRSPWCSGRPLVLLDVPLDSRAEADFARTLVSCASEAFITVPEGDGRSIDEWTAAGAAREEAPDPAAAGSDLRSLRRYIFTVDRPESRAAAGDVRMFSAPGEGREAVEVVRRVLDEAAAGVRFDEMAVLLRAPRQYRGLFEHACARAGIQVYFERGTRRPDPSGRALLALLGCAAEGLSAKRFDEYLSLGQVPRLAASGREPRHGPDDATEPVLPRDEIHGALMAYAPDDALAGDEPDWEETAAPAPAAEDPGADSDADAVVSGTLRAPWKWEELIVESAVVGGRSRADGRARWQRRLNGLAADYRFRLGALRRDEPESPLGKRIERDLRNLMHLQAFALPLIDQLASWPETATWGDWMARFRQLAVHALKSPDRVLRVLAELRPMSEVGPVELDEARRVLHDRLAHLDWEPVPRRYGRLFIGTPHQVRGRTFRVVFVPGLAERIVPQRPAEDPLLLDRSRAALGLGLVQQHDRGAAERLLLKIAIGAATERVYLSYPRLDGAAEGRARVPSFYALDVMRAITGTVPDHRLLAQAAAEEAGASLSWPAPLDATRAIDDLEHDLAVLRPLMDTRDSAAVKGRAHYLLGLNKALHRSVTSRWLRDKRAWSKHDGLVAPSPTTGLRRFLAGQRLGARPYSLSALQRFATCPYQFLLSTIHRLEPWTEPEPLLRMDPLTRGSLFHKVQAELLRTLKAKAELPITPANVAACVRMLEEVVAGVAAQYAESLMPAIERVWRDEVAELGRDLAIWVRKLSDAPEWRPEYFEFSFGLNDDGRDPRSLPDPVAIDDRFVLRGSVDLIEQHARLDILRVTDHKTGRNRSTPDLVVGGGRTLQPVLYSMAIERGLGRSVFEGRLFYCTTAGGFGEHAIRINDFTRQQALEVLTIVDRAIEDGFLVAAPEERACTWCDFRAVCGPREHERLARKAADRLADLEVLRSMR